MLAIEDDLALQPTRQFEAFDERISRIDVSFTRVAIAVTSIVQIARIDVFAIQSGLTPQFNPWHLDVADVVVAVARIEIQHLAAPGWRAESRLLPTSGRFCELGGPATIRDRMASGRVRSSVLSGQTAIMRARA